MSIQVGRGDGSGIKIPTKPRPPNITVEQFDAAHKEIGTLRGHGLRVTIPENRGIDKTQHRQQQMSQDIQRFPMLATLMKDHDLEEWKKELRANGGFFFWGIVSDDIYAVEAKVSIKDDKKTIRYLDNNLHLPDEATLEGLMSIAGEADPKKSQNKVRKLRSLIDVDRRDEPHGYNTRRQPGEVGKAISVIVGWWGLQDLEETMKRMKEFNDGV